MNITNYSLPSRLSRCGFTLIELLVVVAIIALLAAILFPVFARARENARRSSCQSNLKQIMLGITQYTQDYDERLPLQSEYSFNFTMTGYPNQWPDEIMPYTKSAQIFACPSGVTKTHKPGTDVDDTTNMSHVNVPKLNYIVNGMYADDALRGRLFLIDNDFGYTPSSIASVEDVAGTVAVLEGGGGYGNYINHENFYNLNYYPNHEPPIAVGLERDFFAAGSAGVIARHLGTVNVAFVDGHVKAMNFGQLFERAGNRYKLFTKNSD